MPRHEVLFVSKRVFRELNVDFIKLKSINCYKPFPGKLNFEGGGCKLKGVFAKNEMGYICLMR